MSLSEDFNAIPKLFGDAVEQLGKLVQNEAQLARAELSQKITQAGIGALMWQEPPFFAYRFLSCC